MDARRLRLVGQLRALARNRLQLPPLISSPSGNKLRVDPDPGRLEEIMLVVGHADVHPPHPAASQHPARRLQIERQTQRAREIVVSAHRQDAQRAIRADQPLAVAPTVPSPPPAMTMENPASTARLATAPAVFVRLGLDDLRPDARRAQGRPDLGNLRAPCRFGGRAGGGIDQQAGPLLTGGRNRRLFVQDFILGFAYEHGIGSRRGRRRLPPAQGGASADSNPCARRLHQRYWKRDSRRRSSPTTRRSSASPPGAWNVTLKRRYAPASSHGHGGDEVLGDHPLRASLGVLENDSSPPSAAPRALRRGRRRGKNCRAASPPRNPGCAASARAGPSGGNISRRSAR